MFGFFKKKVEPNLDRSREEIVNRILSNNEAFYDIERFGEDMDVPLVARCDFFQRVEKYLLSRKAELYTTEAEEFLYIFSTEHLGKELFEKCKEYALKDSEPRMNIGPEHMCSYVSYYFIVDSYDEEVAALIRKCKIYKSFKFSLQGWMSGRMTMVCLDDKVLIHNSDGKAMTKALAQILIH